MPKKTTSQQITVPVSSVYDPKLDRFDMKLLNIRKDYKTVGIKAANLIARYEQCIEKYGNDWINHMFSIDEKAKESKSMATTSFRNMYYLSKDETSASKFLIWDVNEVNYGGIYWPEKPKEDYLKQIKVSMSITKYKQYVKDKDYNDPSFVEPEENTFFKAVDIVSRAHVVMGETLKANKLIPSKKTVNSKIKTEKTDKKANIVDIVPKFTSSIKIASPPTEIIVVENGIPKDYTGIPISKVPEVIRFGDDIAKIETSNIRSCDCSAGINLTFDIAKIRMVQKSQQKVEYDEEDVIEVDLPDLSTVPVPVPDSTTITTDDPETDKSESDKSESESESDC